MLLDRWRVLPAAVLLVTIGLIPAIAQATGATSSPDMSLFVWELIRGSGLTAFVLLSISILMGIAIRVRALDFLMGRGWVNELHQTISVLSLIFVVFHVALVLLHDYVPFSLVEVLVPFASDWKPGAAALGTISLYLLVLLIGSSWLRPNIGFKTWRAIHFAGFLAWPIAMLHGVTAGSDSGEAWVQYLYLGTGALFAFLVTLRVMTPQPSREGGAVTSAGPPDSQLAG